MSEPSVYDSRILDFPRPTIRSGDTPDDGRATTPQESPGTKPTTGQPRAGPPKSRRPTQGTASDDSPPPYPSRSVSPTRPLSRLPRGPNRPQGPSGHDGPPGVRTLSGDAWARRTRTRGETVRREAHSPRGLSVRRQHLTRQSRHCVRGAVHLMSFRCYPIFSSLSFWSHNPPSRV
jgi:hypothetical protein